MATTKRVCVKITVLDNVETTQQAIASWMGDRDYTLAGEDDTFDGKVIYFKTKKRIVSGELNSLQRGLRSLLDFEANQLTVYID